MSFTGDLEHLPIVDVIQLLHSTRKSGILRVTGRKGESKLVFKDGGIVSANHLNNSIRIGQILIEQKVITQEVLDRVLDEQREAGDGRKPLIVSLIENGLVNEREAYKGLEYLIEMTIVEILTWKRGTFFLDIEKETAVSDEYRYYPQKMSKEINVDTQSVLMDALRIFDEKIRDGELHEEELADDEPSSEGCDGGGAILTADDLGLTDLEQMEKTIPGVFTTLKDLDPVAIHRQRIEDLAAGLSPAEQQELLGFLRPFLSVSVDERGSDLPDGERRDMVLFSRDDLLAYAVTTVCKQDGLMVHTSRDAREAEQLVVQSMGRHVAPVLVMDAPSELAGGVSVDELAALRQQLGARYPHVPLIQLVSPLAREFSLRSLQDGVASVFPRPLREERRAAFVGDLIQFLESFGSFIRKGRWAQYPIPLGKLCGCIGGLRDLRDAPEVAFSLLQFVADVCGRAITLVAGQGELIAEKGIGVSADREVTPAVGFRVPLDRPSVLQQALVAGCPFRGQADDQIAAHLFAAIGAPRYDDVFILPLRSRGKTVALIYGDFGSNEPKMLPVEFLEILAGQAELVLDNVFLRKKLEKVG
jgi:hypothetical protein